MTIIATAVYPPPGAAFDETINRATSGTDYCVDGTSDFYQIHGYNVGNYDYHNDSAYGSITGTTYVDGGSTTRTVAAVWWTEPGAGGCTGTTVGLSLQGINIPNTNTTFVEMEYEDNTGTLRTFTRSSATYTASSNGGTHWRWSDGSNNFSTGTARVIRIYI